LLDAAGNGILAYAGALVEVVVSVFALVIDVGCACDGASSGEAVEAMSACEVVSVGGGRLHAQAFELGPKAASLSAGDCEKK
jgi:hypothetical protein